ncbi:AaceriAGL205Cp [[Ashbya] aceris (nom. inval.)]|nr:AaceriAGL205Cp [[Ashbya] aceris (nom. inval.)]
MGSPTKPGVPGRVATGPGSKYGRSPLKENDPNNQFRGVKAGIGSAVQCFAGKKRSLNLLEETEKVRSKRAKAAGLAHPTGSPITGSAASGRTIEGAVLITRQQAQRRAEQSKITAKDLLDWQQNWKRIMRKDTRIYFDTAVVDHLQGAKLEKRKELLKRGFSILGAQMKVFFDMDVTIVITSRKLDRYDNLPETDVLFRAYKSSYMKIWNYDKALRFLKNLEVDVDGLEQQHAVGASAGGPLLVIGSGNHNSGLAANAPTTTNATATLSKLLESEKLYGPSDRDPKAKRDDVHYFRYPHVYLYDIWQTWAPLITVEWRPSELTDPEKLPYPSVKPGSFGRCPFVGDGTCDELSTRRILKRYKRDCLNENYALKLRLIYQDSAVPRQIDDISEDEYPIMLPNTTQYPNSKTKYMEVMGIDDSKCKRPPPMSLLTRQETAGEDALGNDDLCKRKNRIPQEIKASGVNQSLDTNAGGSLSIGNGLAPAKASNLNKNLKSLNRLVVDRKFTQHTIPPPPQAGKPAVTAACIQEKHSVSPQDSPVPNPTVTASPVPTKRPLQGKLGGGYCENCRVKYDHLDQHIRTEKHQSFAENDNKFERIDSLINTLRDEYTLYGSSQ